MNGSHFFTRRVTLMNPHYYIMKNRKVLRLESEMTFESLPEYIKFERLEDAFDVVLDQNQANWRVVIFRDEIMELDEYTEYLRSEQYLEDQEQFDMIANF
jgi:predicted transport protein